ncbi:MAG: Luciferase-like, subgroup [Acidimicrobiia bacterium]|nr:Luciferase-like, subgroup [Acidimicrobiia bacterium]
MTPQFQLFLPQMRFTMEAIVERAQGAEAAGFDGVAFIDHLAPPMALTQPMHEAMTTATWVASRTERMSVGHLVLCDAFRQPALLAKQAVTLDDASGGRFEIGIGWGSTPEEFGMFGIATTEPPGRVRRLDETLQVMRLLWSGEAFDFDGEFHRLVGAQQLPVPTRPIPILIGGTGPRTLQLVAKHADWWNVPLTDLDKLDDLREKVGSARVSIQQMVALVPSEEQRQQVTELAQKRFGAMGGLVVGNAAELTDHFAGLAARGVERFYIWFADFAAPETLASFGADVISPLAR